MLSQEAQMAADEQLELGRVHGRREDVEGLRAGIEEHLPPRPAKAVAPVHLLAHQEEVLVEAADGVDRLAPDEQTRPAEELRLANRFVVEARSVEGVQRPRA